MPSTATAVDEEQIEVLIGVNVCGVALADLQPGMAHTCHGLEAALRARSRRLDIPGLEIADSSGEPGDRRASRAPGAELENRVDLLAEVAQRHEVLVDIRSRLGELPEYHVRRSRLLDRLRGIRPRLRVDREDPRRCADLPRAREDVPVGLLAPGDLERLGDLAPREVIKVALGVAVDDPAPGVLQGRQEGRPVLVVDAGVRPP